MWKCHTTALSSWNSKCLNSTDQLLVHALWKTIAAYHIKSTHVDKNIYAYSLRMQVYIEFYLDMLLSSHMLKFCN